MMPWVNFQVKLATFSDKLKGNKKYMHNQNVILIKELHNNLHNIGFRNSFCLCENCNFVVIFWRDFISMDSSFKLVSWQQPRYISI